MILIIFLINIIIVCDSIVVCGYKYIFLLVIQFLFTKMECPIVNCQCICHKSYQQEINIKELLINQLKGNKSQSNSMLLFTEDDDDPQNNKQNPLSVDDDHERLWDRRRKIKSGEIKPHSHDDFKEYLYINKIHKNSASSSADNNQQNPIKSSDKEEFAKQTIAQQIVQDSGCEQQRFRRNSSDESFARQTVHNECPLDRKENGSTNASKPITGRPKSEPLGDVPVPLNPLHKYKINERDIILKDIYTKAVRLVKSEHPALDVNCSTFKNHVNSEADKLLKIWMENDE